MKRRYSAKKPRLTNGGGGGTSVRIQHKEQILDVLVPANGGTFQIIKAFSINPGLKDTFPWLSGLANNYEECDWHSLCFYFRSTTSDSVATSPALGSIIMATQYNALDDGYQDKREMENASGVVSSKISMDCKHTVRCKGGALETQFIRSGAVPTGGDARMSDLGRTFIASSGLPIGGSFVTGQQMGELWVKYDVTLKKPVWNTGSQAGEHWVLGTNAQVLAATPLGLTSVALSPTMGGTITSGTTYNFPPSMKSGKYLMNYYVQGGATAGLTAPSFTLTNCQALKGWVGNPPSASSVGTPNGNTSAVYIANLFIEVLASNAKITFGTAGVIPTAVTGADLWFIKLDDNFTLSP